MMTIIGVILVIVLLGLIATDHAIEESETVVIITLDELKEMFEEES